MGIWKNSIVGKIWIGIFVIITGYVISTVSFYGASQFVLKQMKRTASARFPASKLSQDVLYGFEDHMKLFND